LRTQLAILYLAIAHGAPCVAADAPPWTHAEYKASKLFMTIRLDMELATVTGDALAEATSPAFEGEAIEPTSQTAAVITLTSKRSDQTKTTRLYMDPDTGAALLRTQREMSSSPDAKDLRYTRTGIARTRSEPLRGEARKPPSEWGQVRRQFRPFPPVDENAIISDTAALPYLIARTDWTNPGDSFDLLAFEDMQLVKVTATAVRWNETRVDYRTDQGRVDGRKRLMEVRVIASPLAGNGKANIDLFGLSSDVLLLVDTGIGVPVEIRGSVAFLGEVRFGLEQVRQQSAGN
jgi:hypothetical protein